MRYSCNWLKDFLPSLDQVPEETADILTRHSFETEAAYELKMPSGVVAVKIKAIDPHPHADRLRLAVVTDGRREFTVVCGAGNIAAGQTVPYSPPGAVLKDEAGRNFTVKEAVIRGVKSPGMLTSLRELGWHYKEHEGIWILPDDVPAGVELAGLMPADTVLDAEITPNRAHDCLSHRGLARELAAVLDLDVNEPEIISLPEPRQKTEGFSVAVEDKTTAPRYVGVVLGNVRAAVSPLWLQARLLAAGGKPINSLVDVTNYVAYELGNPVHAFDADKLPAKDIGVRGARRGEKLSLLDGTRLDLKPLDLVITAGGRPVALAGIMGGTETGVSERTKNVFLEAANFNAYRVQETSRRLGQSTEASVRFSKGLDINLAPEAAARAVQLWQEICSAKLSGTVDTNPPRAARRVVSFNPSRIRQAAGSSAELFTGENVRRLLKRLRFKVNDHTTPWRVSVPTDRLDVRGEHDLTEEVIRLAGLEKVKAAAVGGASRPARMPAWSWWPDVIRDVLAELGLTETINYSFCPAEYARLLDGEEEKDCLRLVNPVSPDKACLRRSLLPGLLQNLAVNREIISRAAGGRENSLFEIGHVYAPGKGGRVPGVSESAHLAAVVAGPAPSLDDIAGVIAEALGLDALTLKNAVPRQAVRALKYRVPVFGFEIDLGELLTRVEIQPPPPRTLEEVRSYKASPAPYTPLPRYPASYRDLSVLVELSVTVEQVQEVIERVGGRLLADVDLFDEFQPSGSGQKSYAFHLMYQSPHRTLTDEEVSRAHNKIVDRLKAELNIQTR